jgi:hypothetical protein
MQIANEEATPFDTNEHGTASPALNPSAAPSSISDLESAIGDSKLLIEGSLPFAPSEK